MFYIFFALTIFLSLFVIWVGANLYAIFYLSHRAEVLLGRIMVLLQKRQSLINNVLNEIPVSNEDVIKIFYEIRELTKEVKEKGDLHEKLIIDRAIEEKIEAISGVSVEGLGVIPLLNELKTIFGDLLEHKERYNKVVLRLQELYKKMVIRRLIEWFHIKKMELL